MNLTIDIRYLMAMMFSVSKHSARSLLAGSRAMSFDPRDADRVRTCELCEQEPACDEHDRLCTECLAQAERDGAVSTSPVCPRCDTRPVGDECEGLCVECYTVSLVARRMRNSVAENDDGDRRPCTPAPAASITPAVYIPRVTPPPTRFWDPAAITIRPGRA